MSDPDVDLEKVTKESVLELIEQSFPGFACIRCGNREFDVDGAASTFGTITSALLAMGRDVPVDRIDQYFDLECKRCGFVERHKLKTLLMASKPVSRASA